ncbi:MAG: hypothetical protein HXY34_06305 [Candidatus Thorarchaeota archaeon]|nr:hypothetical protein [Candidatus Thorarchaeota archaeon]
MSDAQSIVLQAKKAKRIIRTLLVGDGGVGKTTLIYAIKELSAGHATERSEEGSERPGEGSIKRTPFMEIATWCYDGVTVQCFDLAGQRIEGTHPLDLVREQVVTLIDVLIMVFSLERYESFERLYQWIELLRTGPQVLDDTVKMVLVGNKSDCERCVSRELIEPIVGEGRPFLKYFETCAIDDQGVSALMQEIARLGGCILDGIV